MLEASKASKTAETAKKNLEILKKDSSLLQQKLSPDADFVEFEKSLADVILAVMKGRIEHSLTISVLAVEKKGGSSTALVSELAQAVPGTKVKTARINIRGGYSSYEGLKTFVESLTKQYPVAVVGLKVDNRVYELALRVYGN